MITMKSRIVVLREERSREGSRHLAASVTKAGDLNIKGHDLGPGVEKAFGEGLTEYEWTITVRKDHVPNLIAALGGNKRDNVLTLLAARFAED